MKSKKILFTILLLLSPGFWRTLTHSNVIAGEFYKFPNYALQNYHNLFSDEKLAKIKTMRWVHVDADFKLFYFSKAAYNKVTLLTDEFIGYLTFYSPRLYFQSGDGSELSFSNLEPIPFLLFPFWILGLTQIIKKGKIRLIFLYLILGLIAFAAGKKSFSYLWPILIINVYISYIGIESLGKGKKKSVYLIVIVYSTFLMTKALFSL